MTDGLRTEIRILLDASTSMRDVEKYGDVKPYIQAINGFNDMVRDLRGSEAYNAPSHIAVFTFNSINVAHPLLARTELSGVRELTQGDYRLDGRTPLLDALGHQIDQLGYIREPGGRLVVVLTDGKENESTRYSWNGIRETIRDKQDRYGWKFLYIGVGQTPETAEDVAERLGMDAGSALGVARAATQTSFAAVELAARS
jgi:Mg-chelatase subunit ChlD